MSLNTSNPLADRLSPGGLQGAPLSGQPNQRPIGQVMADGDAAKHERLEDVVAHEAAEEPEKSRAEILLSVENDWDYCGQIPRDSATAERLADLLLTHQQRKQTRDPEYRVGEAETSQDLAMIVDRGMRRRARQAKEMVVEEKRSGEREKAKVDAQAYVDWKDQFSGDFVAAVGAADTLPVGEPPSPELLAARAQLMQFNRILTLARRISPADHAIISQRMGALDMSQGVPSAINFIQTSVFSSPEHLSGVSDAAQAMIAAEFKLTPRAIVTGTDYANAMGETRPGENGEPVPVCSKDAPLIFGVGVEGYPSANGQEQFMQAIPNHGSAWRLNVTSLLPAEKGIAASLLSTWAMMEDAGEVDFLIDMTKIDLSLTNAIDPLALRQTAKILNALYGGHTGYNGEIVHGDNKAVIIRWQAQLRSPKGGAARGDRNASMTDDALRGLGIRDASGRIDTDVLQAFGDYSRDNWFGAPGYEDAQAHLVRLFPNKFEGEGDGYALKGI